MEFKKCKRCGCFFVTQDEVCPNCKPKDQNDQANLSNYLQENGLPNSVEELSSYTNISVRNLNRFLAKEQFAGYHFKSQETNIEVGL